MRETQTILQVNGNRFREGARVLEDLARFTLKDMTLFTEIKALKHRIHPFIAITPTHHHDIGGSDFVENNCRHHLSDLVNANASRMQESARVLEELTSNHQFKVIRFACYELQKKLIEAVKTQQNIQAVRGFYPICDPTQNNISDMSRLLNQSDVTLCQLRMKNASKKMIYQTAKQFREHLDNHIKLIINDHLDIALLTADGVHLGQNDLPLEASQQLCPKDFIIGVTCRTVNEAQTAASSGAQYLSVGAIHPSQTKPDATLTSTNTLKKIIDCTSVPVGAIGGVQKTDIAPLTALGVTVFAMGWPSFKKMHLQGD